MIKKTTFMFSHPNNKKILKSTFKYDIKILNNFYFFKKSFKNWSFNERFFLKKLIQMSPIYKRHTEGLN